MIRQPEHEEAPPVAGGPESRPESVAPGASAGAEGTGPCDSRNLELSSPRGVVLQSSRLILRWRSEEGGPFQVSIAGEDGRQVYGANTFGHELRVLVAPEEEAGSGDGELRSGRTYRWRVVPQFAPDASVCPTAEFQLLRAAESQRRAAALEAEAKRLGVGDEAREPGATIALAETLVKEGLYGEAEGRLLRLIQQGYDDERIKGLLERMYRDTGRGISLRELPQLAPAGDLPF